MDAVRRHETPGSEKKDFIIHDTRTARALCFHLFFLSVSAFSEVIKEAQVDIIHIMGLHHKCRCEG